MTNLSSRERMVAFGARDQGELEGAIKYAQSAKENFTIIQARAALVKLNQFIKELKD